MAANAPLEGINGVLESLHEIIPLHVGVGLQIQLDIFVEADGGGSLPAYCWVRR
jgi:hypothetical protein